MAAQAATVLVTWPLWQTRRSPAPVPLFPLPDLDFAAPMLASLAVVLMRPRLGVALHALAFACAALADQTRLQPEVISMILLLAGTLGIPSLRDFARAHLVALWLFAGLSKLFGPADMVWIADRLLARTGGESDAASGRLFALVVLGTELALGALALAPTTRRAAAFLAAGLHAGILASLILIDWNAAVWPWNIALGCAGFALLSGWEDPARAFLAGSSRSRTAAVWLLLLSPAGYYAGVLDAYLAHALYSSNVPMARVHSPDGSVRRLETWDELGVPVPPCYRVFEAIFVARCSPGDQLHIAEPRSIVRAATGSERVVECPCAEP